MKINKFYCENCHKAVKPNSKVCPHCGSFFLAVECPSCGFQGEGKLFINGCPKCGYLAPANPGAGNKDAFEYIQDLDPKKRRTHTGAAEPVKKKGPLPSWFYLLAGIILTGSLIALILLYLNL
jgi:hypothetical protein